MKEKCFIKYISFAVSCLIFINFSLHSFSALAITEIESNPAGTDAGNEWIEIYSDGVINLEEYRIVNGDGKNITINESFSGYFVFNLKKQWLDNKNEQVFLYKNNQLVLQSPVFSDSYNNNKTLQECGGEWGMKLLTKGIENECETSPEENSENNAMNNTKNSAENPQNNSNEIKSLETEEVPAKINVINSSKESILKKITIKNESVINLDIQVVYESKNEKIKEYAIYGFAVFLIFIIVVLIIKR